MSALTLLPDVMPGHLIRPEVFGAGKNIDRGLRGKASGKTLYMNKLIRALIAGYGAKKLGGGCFSTIVIFIIIYYLLGQCN